jgi:small subunit ribosomal protein S16
MHLGVLICSSDYGNEIMFQLNLNPIDWKLFPRFNTYAIVVNRRILTMRLNPSPYKNIHGVNLPAMLKLRMKRLGKKRAPSYRIVVAQSTSRRDGLPVAEVGFYDPRSKETRLDMPAIDEWIRKGAQPTETVEKLLKKAKQGE